MDLNELLNRTADHVVADGTYAEALTLRAMAAVAGEVSQGAAAALVDWKGSEIARLRAFGIVHGVLLREISDDAQAQLLADLLAISSAPVPPGRPVLSSAEERRGRSHPVHAVNWSRHTPVRKSRHRTEGAGGVTVR